MSEHLDEIESFDIEHLKSGQEVFECMTCDFKSNKATRIKKHLRGHVLQPKEDIALIANKIKRKTNFKLLVNSKNWRDAYDDEGNPLYSSSDSEQSEDEEK